MKLKYAVLALLLLATPWRVEASSGEDVSEAVPPTEALVTIQRLILTDGSEVCLDLVSWQGTPSEFFKEGPLPDPNTTYGYGRITLPYSARLANGAVLEPGWYSIRVSFNPGEITFQRTKGMQSLQSAYKDLSADIEYRISHADTDGDGSLSRRERFSAFFREALLDPVEDLKPDHVSYDGGSGILHIGESSGILKRVTAPFQVREIESPRPGHALLIPARERGPGTFILQITWGRYQGTTRLSLIKPSQ